MSSQRPAKVRGAAKCRTDWDWRRLPSTMGVPSDGSNLPVILQCTCGVMGGVGKSVMRTGVMMGLVDALERWYVSRSRKEDFLGVERGVSF